MHDEYTSRPLDVREDCVLYFYVYMYLYETEFLKSYVC